MIKMFKKIVSSILVGSTLILGAHNTTEDINNTELQKAINYAPIINQEFKATGQYQITNIKKNTNVLSIEDNKDRPDHIEIYKKYIISFKNDTPIKIEEK